MQARDSFLHSLDFALVGNPAAYASSSPAAPPPVPGVAPAAITTRPQPPPAAPIQQSVQALKAAVAAAPRTESPTAPAAPLPPPAPRAASAAAAGAAGDGTVPVPVDLPPTARGPRPSHMPKVSDRGALLQQCAAAVHEHAGRALALPHARR